MLEDVVMTKQNMTTNIKPCLQHSFVSLCSSRFDGLPPSMYGLHRHGYSIIDSHIMSKYCMNEISAKFL